MTTEEIQKNLEDTCGEALEEMVQTFHSAKAPEELEKLGVTDEMYQGVAKGFVGEILPRMQKMISAESIRLSHINCVSRRRRSVTRVHASVLCGASKI